MKKYDGLYIFISIKFHSITFGQNCWKHHNVVPLSRNKTLTIAHRKSNACLPITDFLYYRTPLGVHHYIDLSGKHIYRSGKDRPVLICNFISVRMQCAVGSDDSVAAERVV